MLYHLLRLPFTKTPIKSLSTESIFPLRLINLSFSKTLSINFVICNNTHCHFLMSYSNDATTTSNPAVRVHTVYIVFCSLPSCHVVFVRNLRASHDDELHGVLVRYNCNFSFLMSPLHNNNNKFEHRWTKLSSTL